MSLNIFSNEAFADWAEKKGDKEYTYASYRGCAIFCYLTEMGVNPESVGGISWWDQQREHVLPAAWVYRVLRLPYTYEALAKRLREDDNV
jgi:hypothetical protein